MNNFYGNVNNVQIQQNTNNSSQNIILNNSYDKREELMDYLVKLKKNIDNIGLPEDKLVTFTNCIEKLEQETNKKECESNIIKKSLSTIRNILEGTAGSLIASGLIYELDKLI